jgi:hypothetical protein
MDIRIYFENKRLLLGKILRYRIGLILDNNTIEYRDDYSIALLEPINAKIDITKKEIKIPARNENVTLRLRVTILNQTQYFSFLVVQDFVDINKKDIENEIISLMPDGIYNFDGSSIVSREISAISSVLYSLYKANNENSYSLYKYRDSLFPSSGNGLWEQALTGSNRRLSVIEADYPALLEHIYSVKRHNIINPYWMAFNISKFIKLWKNKQRYVYMSENIRDYTNCFVINQNSIGNCVFIDDTPDINSITIYVLADIIDDTLAITLEEQAQINDFIYQIIRPRLKKNLQIVYNMTAVDLGLSSIENTYFGDPRQKRTYCIAYQPNVLEEAIGMGKSYTEPYMANLTSVACISHPQNSIYTVSRASLHIPIGGIPLEFTLDPVLLPSINPTDYLQVKVKENSYSSNFGAVYNKPIVSYQSLENGQYKAYLYLSLLSSIYLGVEGDTIQVKVTYYIGNVNTGEYEYNINITP